MGLLSRHAEREGAHRTKGVATNGTGPDEEREQGEATPEGAGRKDRQPETLTLQPETLSTLPRSQKSVSNA